MNSINQCFPCKSCIPNLKQKRYSSMIKQRIPYNAEKSHQSICPNQLHSLRNSHKRKICAQSHKKNNKVNKGMSEPNHKDNGKNIIEQDKHWMTSEKTVHFYLP